MDEEKLLDDYLETMGYKPERDVNGFREIVRNSYQFRIYIGERALYILKEEIIKFFKPIFNRIFRIYF